MPPANKIQDLFNVNGLVAVITGGGSGLGLYAARALDANGAKAVYIIGRREATLKEAAKTGINGSIIPIVGDATSKDLLTKIADQVRKEQGYVNLLFANAGISGPPVTPHLPKKENGEKPTVKEYQDALWQPDMDSFTQTLHVNSTAVFFTAVAFMDLLDAGNKKRNVAQDSQVVVTSSVAGFSRFLASSFAYSISKAAVNHLVKMLATAFAENQLRIRVNLIAPGLYPSEMTTRHTSSLQKFEGINGQWQDAHRMPQERSPAERTGSEQDIAGTILFLASQAGAYLNGETLLTDGGRLSLLPAVY